MADYKLEVTKRSKDQKSNHLRADDKIPAVMYGFETDPTSIVVDRVQLEKLYSEAGMSTIIDLTIDGKVHPVLIQDLQYNPITDFITHADFRRIDISKKVETSITIKFVGESVAVKELGGTLIQSLEEVDISALPNALVRELEIDINKLKTFDDVIRVSDIETPEGIEILTDAERTIATVQPPRVEEVDVIASEATDSEEGEGTAETADGGEDKSKEATESSAE